MDYKRYELKEKTGIRWINLDKNKAFTGIQKRYKATITDEQTAFKNYTSSYAISDIRVKRVKAIQYLKYQDFKIKEYLRKHKGMKVLLQTFSDFKSKKANKVVRREVRSRRYELTNEEEIINVLNQMATDIEHQAEVLEASESGLVPTQMDKIKFNFDKYNPTRGGKFIPSPKWVQNKKACINIQNEDNKCFKYSIQCGICKVYEKDHPNRFYHYKNLNDELNWTNVNVPSSNIDIDTFEEKNDRKVAVNVYFLNPEDDKQSILLYRKTKVQRATHQISLLRLDVYIKDFYKLIGSQTNKQKAKLFHCFHCRHSFQSQALLDERNEKGCMAVEGQRIEMPSSDGDDPDKFFIKFKNHYKKKLKAPFVIYADFECLTTRTGTVSTKEMKTNKYQHHRPCGFMII